MLVCRRVLPALVLFAMLAVPSQAGANDLANGSFEKGLTGWSPLSARLSLESGGARGSKYARATRRTGATFGLSVRPGGTVSANRRVAVRVSLRAPRGRVACIRVREKRAGRLVGQRKRCLQTNGRWQRPGTLAYSTRRNGSTVVLSVYARRAAARNRLDLDGAVLNITNPRSPRPRTIIRTNRSWECRGALRSFGRLPIKVISTMPNPGDGDAIRLIGCHGDGNMRTVDLILDVRGNGSDRGTAFDAVRIGQDARDLVVTGNVECGAKHTNPSIHQDVVQALSGRRIRFRDFTSGNPRTGRWTCWGAGGGWYVTWANGGIPTNLVCVRCKLATYNQNLRIDESVRSGARDSVFGYHRSYGIFIGPDARDPVNKNNRVIRY